MKAAANETQDGLDVDFMTPYVVTKEPVRGFEANGGMQTTMQQGVCFTVEVEGKQKELDGIAKPTVVKAAANETQEDLDVDTVTPSVVEKRFEVHE
eukprot:4217001-Pyramimonas_sp.AAC.1